MKNKRFIIFAFLIVSALIVGVGYAALTDIFIMDGNAVIKQEVQNAAFDEDIYISDAKFTETTGTSGVADTAAKDTVNNDKASFTVKSLALVGETAKFTFTIKNDSDFDATIANTVCTVDDTTHFRVTAVVPTDNICEKGTTLDVIVTVELITAVTSETTANITVNYTATVD